MLIRFTKILPMGIQELNVNCNQNLSIGIMNKEFIEKFSYQDYLENNVTTSFLQTIISEDNISL